MNNERQKLLTLIASIESDIEDARFQGMESPKYWYAWDRLSSIRSSINNLEKELENETK